MVLQRVPDATIAREHLTVFVGVKVWVVLCMRTHALLSIYVFALPCDEYSFTETEQHLRRSSICVCVCVCVCVCARVRACMHAYE